MLQRGQALPGGGGQGHGLFKAPLDCLHVHPGGQVALVHNGDGRHLFQGVHQFPVLFLQGLGGIEHRQHQLGCLQPLPGRLDADALHRVVGIPDARRVRQPQRHPGHHDGLLHHVSGGTCVLGDDGALAPREQIHQSGLSRVGPAGNHRDKALPVHAAPIKALEQLLQGFLPLADALQKRGFLHLGHVLLGEVRPGRQVGSLLQQPLFDGLDFPGQHPGAPRQGGFPGLLPAGGDKAHHRLGLGQVHLAVEEGPAGELPRPGGSGPGIQHQLEQALCHVQPPVAGELHHVLTGVAFWPPVHQGHHVVQLLPAGRIGAPQLGGVALHLGELLPADAPEHLLRHGESLPAGDAHNANAPRRRGGGDGGNGLFHSGPSFPQKFQNM